VYGLMKQPVRRCPLYYDCSNMSFVDYEVGLNHNAAQDIGLWSMTAVHMVDPDDLQACDASDGHSSDSAGAVFHCLYQPTGYRR